MIAIHFSKFFYSKKSIFIAKLIKVANHKPQNIPKKSEPFKRNEIRY